MGYSHLLEILGFLTKMGIELFLGFRIWKRKSWKCDRFTQMEPMLLFSVFI